MKHVMLRNRLKGNSFLLSVTIIMFVAMYLVGFGMYKEQNFGTMQTFLNMLIDNAGLFIAAGGMTIVLIAGGIDISIGSVVGLVCMMLAWLMERKGVSVLASVSTVLVFGTFFGFIQGFLIAYMKLQPFIVTLAGMFFCRGLTAMISVDQIAIKNPLFLAIAQKNFYLPFAANVNKRGKVLYPFIHPNVLIALVALFAIWYMCKYTKFGRSLFAIGGNEQSALLMGINVRRTKLKAYVLNGFLAGLAGFVFCLNTSAGFVEQARGFEMEAIASAVIGGTLLTGGVGSVIGTFFGVLIKATIETFIRCDGTLSSWWNKIVLSILLCFFIVLQSLFAIWKTRKKA